MATDIVGGLFGITPQSYERQQYEQSLREGKSFGTPEGLYASAAQLGRGIGGALGAEDPQLRLISARNAVGQSIDPNDPATIQRGIQQLASMGDQEGAMRLADYLRKAQSDYALIQQRTAEKMTPEQRNALAYAASTGAPQNSPEFGQAYQQKLSELISKTETTTPEMKNAAAVASASFPIGSQEYKELYKNELARLTTKGEKQNVKEVGVAAGSREAVYLDVNNDQQFVYQKGADGKQIRVPYFGGIDRVTSSTKVEAEKKQTEFEKILDKKDADRVDAAMTSRDNSIASLNSLQRLNQLDQSALISGAFAANRVGLTNFLNTLGLTSLKDRDDLAKSENYQKTAGDVILATLGGRLGSGFSNADREFIQSLVPQLNNSPDARKQLIEFMVKKNQTIINEASRLENYARDKKTLKGFVPTIPLVSTQPTTSGALQSMSTEQLQQMLKTAK
jgi:hypothetical protein